MSEAEGTTPYQQALLELKEAERRAEAIRKQELKNVVAEIKEKMRFYGISAKDLGLSESGELRDESLKKDKRSEVKAKYRSSGGATWAGRGKKPDWVVTHLNAGGTLDELLIREE